jgi:hypothetical protein
MPRIGRPLALLALPALACLAWAHPAAVPAGAAAAVEPRLTQQVTLYQHDFLRRSISLATGEYGLAIEDYQVKNLDSELDFGGYYPNLLLAGVQGGQVGRLIDLGTGDELAQRYGYQETVGGGQGFASIHFEGQQLVILQDYATQTFQPFTDGARLYHAAPPALSQPIAVEVGHIYLVDIRDKNDPTFRRFAKLIVTAHTDDEQVTIAWEEIMP